MKGYLRHLTLKVKENKHIKALKLKIKNNKLARINENTINFMGIEMRYINFITLIRAVEEEKAKVKELLKEDAESICSNKNKS